MKVEIFYFKKGSRFRFGFADAPKTMKDFMKDYVKVWSKDLVGLGLEDGILDGLFSKFNLGNNPLSTPENQEMLRNKNVRHTSMSVGDVIKLGNVYYYCDNEGWERIELK